MSQRAGQIDQLCVVQPFGLAHLRVEVSVDLERQQAADAVASGRFNRVPVLLGQTRDEGTYFAALAEMLFFPITGFDDAGYAAARSLAFDPATADQVGRRYPSSVYGGSGGRAWAAVVTDRGTCIGIRSTGELAGQVRTFQYEFADATAPVHFRFPAPPTFSLDAYHGAELPFLFDLVDTPVDLSPSQERLSGRLIGYWSNFAHRGDPNGADLPQWQPVAPGTRRPGTQSLDIEPAGVTRVDLSREHQCDFWGKWG